VNEVEFQAAANDMCASRGLLWHHCKDSRCCAGPRGFPDLFAAGPGGAQFFELKSDRAQTTAEQDDFLWHLDRARWYKPRVIRPGDVELLAKMLDRLKTPVPR
jgi:hypothetical protein